MMFQEQLAREVSLRSALEAEIESIRESVGEKWTENEQSSILQVSGYCKRVPEETRRKKKLLAELLTYRRFELRSLKWNLKLFSASSTHSGYK